MTCQLGMVTSVHLKSSPTPSGLECSSSRPSMSNLCSDKHRKFCLMCPMSYTLNTNLVSLMRARLSYAPASEQTLNPNPRGTFYSYI